MLFVGVGVCMLHSLCRFEDKDIKVHACVCTRDVRSHYLQKLRSIIISTGQRFNIKPCTSLELLSPSVQVKERPDVGVYVKDLSTFVVKNPEQMDKLMSRGAKNRELTFLCAPLCSCVIV